MKNLFKKIGALLVAAVMVLSMCTAVFATEQETSVANDKASLTVKGLVPGENTTVAVYKVVGWSAEHSSWEVENEAIKNDVNLDKNPVTIDWKSIANKRENLTPVISDTKEVPENGEVKFDNLAIGAYYVYAASKKTTYNPMGEAVYGYDDNGLMIAQDKTIDAKGSTYTLTKAFTGDDGQTTY